MRIHLRSCLFAGGAGLGAFLVILPMALDVVSCGGASSSPPDSGDGSMPTDSATDGSSSDGLGSMDALSDASSSELDAPSSDGDAGVIQDAPSDAALLDGPQAEAGDGASGCSVVVPDAGDFFQAYAAALCTGLANCCNVGSSFNMPECLSALGAPGSGSFLGIGFPSRYLEGGRVSYDPISACKCLEQASSFNCGLIPAQTLDSIQQSCLGAIQGTSSISMGEAGTSTACASSYECAPGAFCTTEYPGDPDANIGTCQALVADGGTCTSDNQCSYLGNGQPSLYCGPSSTCIPRLSAGTTCSGNGACASNVCVSPSCASGLVFASSGTCAFLTKADGG